MQYILSSEEYESLLDCKKSLSKNLVLIQNSEKIVDTHLEAIGTSCIHKQGSVNYRGYCDDCPFGASYHENFLFKCSRSQDFSQ